MKNKIPRTKYVDGINKMVKNGRPSQENNGGAF